MDKPLTIATFYLLPKVHKSFTNPQGRPTVSDIRGLCEKVCIYLDFYLQPFVLQLESYTRDSMQLIEKLENNTNINYKVVVSAIVYYLVQQTDSNRVHDSLIIDLRDFVLQHNYFMFGKHFYKQVSGKTMGARCAPS